MSKRKTALWLGILVAVLPFLGIPSSWKTVLYLASGIFIAWNSYQLNKHKTARGKKAKKATPAVVGMENAPSPHAAGVALHAAPLEKKGNPITPIS